MNLYEYALKRHIHWTEEMDYDDWVSKIRADLRRSREATKEENNSILAPEPPRCPACQLWVFACSCTE